jgi:hypothetical protein
MVRYFTHYWKRENCDYNVKWEGSTLEYVEGSQFTGRGVAKGNFIYAMTLREGKLFLISKMQVGKIVFSKEKVKDILRLDYEPMSAKEYLIAKLGTPMRFNREVPLDIVKRLRFISSKRQLLKFKPGTKRLDQQTLRTLRELTPASAAELDKLLESMSEVAWAQTWPGEE